MAFVHFEPVVRLFSRIQSAMDQYNFGGMMLKPKQVQCWEHLVNGRDVIGVLPTGYGKSLIYQLIGDIIPAKKVGKNNIVIVVCPLNSIMEEQICALKTRIGIKCGVLRVRENTKDTVDYSLFTTEKKSSSDGDALLRGIKILMDPAADDASVEDEVEDEVGDVLLEDIGSDVARGSCTVVMGHPEAFLSPQGRKLLRSQVYQKRVVAVVIDEAHCVQTW